MQTRKTLMISAAAVALTMAAPSAQAASAYVSLFGGASFLQKPGLSGTSKTHTTTYYFFKSSQSVDTSFKTGFVIGGNFGVDWGTFRTELELAMRGNKSSKTAHLKQTYQSAVHIGTAVYTNYNGFNTSTDKNVAAKLNLYSYSLMANAWYDFHDILPHGITPYIGGGVGLAEIQLSGSLNGAKINEKNDTVFAWQLGAGVSAPLTKSLTMFLDYRYFDADSAALKIEPGYHGGNITADFRDHSVLVGLRINL